MVNKKHPYLPNQIIRKNPKNLDVNNLNIFEIQWKEGELVATIFYSFTLIPSIPQGSRIPPPDFLSVSTAIASISISYIDVGIHTST